MGVRVAPQFVCSARKVAPPRFPPGVGAKVKPGVPDHRRVFIVETAAEAEELVLAYRRFLELRGRAFTLPGSRSNARIIDRARAQKVCLVFWSEPAARLFDAFWPRYRAVFRPHLQQSSRRPSELARPK